MKFTPRIRQAINVAALAHKGQNRKFGELPYVSHPFGVAFILSNYTDDEDVIIAGLLHDIIEDVDPKVYGADDIKHDFGSRVLTLVQGVTEDKSQTDYRKRKQAYLDHLATADQATMLISAADFTHNMQSLAEDITRIGIDTWRSGIEPASRVWFYRTRYEFLKSHLQSDLINDVEAAYQSVQALIGS